MNRERLRKDRNLLLRTAMKTNQEPVAAIQYPLDQMEPEEFKTAIEQMGLDQGRQNTFVATTRSSRVIMAALCKTPQEDLRIWLITNGRTGTKAIPLTGDRLPELFERDLFADFDHFTEEESTALDTENPSAL